MYVLKMKESLEKLAYITPDSNLLSEKRILKT